jgi:folate-binding protein YgfZ
MIAAVTTYYANLKRRGSLQIEGPQAISFLQGQTTCDLEQLTEELAMAGAYCTPQGRMVCDFRIFSTGTDSYLLQMPRDVCPSALTVFAKYIVFSKAEITDASANWQQFAVWGDSAARELKAEHQAANQLWRDGDCFWLRAEGTEPRFEVSVPWPQAEAFAADLAGRFQARTEADWQLQEIDQGIGHVEAATVESFLPQMLNFQFTDRVSFTKGCYTGQEVVARMHYRGKLKRPMYRAALTGQDVPAAGTALFTAGSQQSVGTVVNAASDAATIRLLAVIKSDSLAAGVHLTSPDGPQLEILDLPYPVDA